MGGVNDILQHADQDFEASIGRLADYLKIPSISADPAYGNACLQAAEWTRSLLADMGFETGLLPTPAHPVVIGRFEPDHMDSNTLHILCYGHYDVQPPDPIELWKTPPFEPSRRKGNDGIERIYARGACDDKGQLMTILEASRAWLRTRGRLPCKITVLVEGDEESDCSHLDAFLADNRRDLAADVAFVCDTAMWDVCTPAITTRLRGCVMDELTISGPRIDLHSGGYGSAAANPIHILTAILADLRDGNGRVRIPGFYRNVRKVPPAVLKQWKKLRFNEREFLAGVGLATSKGEKGFSVLEQIWARPTCEVNGILGGYTGEGGKTIIPAKASAKLSFRLVAGQDPEAIRKSFRSFVKERIPRDCEVSFNGYGGAAPAVELLEDNAFLRKAAAALKDEWGRQPVFLGSGGSVPIVGSFERVLGMQSIMAGFSLDDDAAHSPNEKYDLRCYRGGIRSWIRILDAVTNPSQPGKRPCRN
jgi:acetylornithine deacetylase/succinyl-diaminopimelate desuccinylase-like protein